MCGRSVQGNEDCMRTEKDNTKIMIMGEEWKITRDKVLNGVDGTCDWSSKTINLCKHAFDDFKIDCRLDNVDIYKSKVLRHEALHALGFESGLGCNSFLQNEECVDWIAIMYPKMKKIFEELEIEG